MTVSYESTDRMFLFLNARRSAVRVLNAWDESVPQSIRRDMLNQGDPTGLKTKGLRSLRLRLFTLFTL